MSPYLIYLEYCPRLSESSSSMPVFMTDSILNAYHKVDNCSIPSKFHKVMYDEIHNITYTHIALAYWKPLELFEGPLYVRTCLPL